MLHQRFASSKISCAQTLSPPAQHRKYQYRARICDDPQVPSGPAYTLAQKHCPRDRHQDKFLFLGALSWHLTRKGYTCCNLAAQAIERPLDQLKYRVAAVSRMILHIHATDPKYRVQAFTVSSWTGTVPMHEPRHKNRESIVDEGAIGAKSAKHSKF